MTDEEKAERGVALLAELDTMRDALDEWTPRSGGRPPPPWAFIEKAANFAREAGVAKSDVVFSTAIMVLLTGYCRVLAIADACPCEACEAERRENVA